MSEKTGFFVTFEGIDGSGKSTISKKVAEKLWDDGLSVVLTCEPTDSWIGKKVKQGIEQKSDPINVAFNFILDRIEHSEKIKSWISEGKIVLCDRYVESTYAYQGSQLEEKIDKPFYWLKELSVKSQIIFPDRTFLLLIRPDCALDRIQNRDNLIPFEKIHFLEKVHNNYLKVCKGKRFKKIDALERIDKIVDVCVEDIKNFI